MNNRNNRNKDCTQLCFILIFLSFVCNFVNKPYVVWMSTALLWLYYFHLSRDQLLLCHFLRPYTVHCRVCGGLRGFSRLYEKKRWRLMELQEKNMYGAELGSDIMRKIRTDS